MKCAGLNWTTQIKLDGTELQCYRTDLTHLAVHHRVEVVIRKWNWTVMDCSEWITELIISYSLQWLNVLVDICSPSLDRLKCIHRVMSPHLKHNFEN